MQGPSVKQENKFTVVLQVNPNLRRPEILAVNGHLIVRRTFGLAD
jgi:hypothetical protein